MDTQLKHKLDSITIYANHLHSICMDLLLDADKIETKDPKLTFIKKRINKAVAHLTICSMNCTNFANKLIKTEALGKSK